MQKLSRRTLLKSAAAAGALAATEGVFAPAIAENKPIKIGVLAPRSGIAAAPGENGIRATQWAVERYNAKGGIGGRKVELVLEEESNPKNTIERFIDLLIAFRSSLPCVLRNQTGSIGLNQMPTLQNS